MRIAITAVSVLILAYPALSQAQILKCVGKDGKIEFATACPPGTKQQETGVTSRPAPTPAPAKGDTGAKGATKGEPASKAAEKPDSQKTQAEKDADFRKRLVTQQETAAKAEKSTAEDARRKQACEDARASIKRLQERQRTTRTDPKTGERVFFEEADFVREIANTERVAAENCK